MLNGVWAEEQVGPVFPAVGPWQVPPPLQASISTSVKWGCWTTCLHSLNPVYYYILYNGVHLTLERRVQQTVSVKGRIVNI